MKKNKGFSLVELIIVIAIMAVLIAVLAPQYIKYVEKSRKAKDDKLAEEILELANVIAADEDYFGKVDDGDYIELTDQSISSNNSVIEDEILPEYISGWQSVHIQSKEYSGKSYRVSFVADASDNKLAIQVGWN